MYKRFDDFDEEAKRYKEIILNYRDKGEVFIDQNFHPSVRIPETKVSLDESKIDWRRIDEFYKAPLFKNDLIQIDFIKQGTLSDCYFLSAISQISMQPYLIPFLFDRQVDSILGKIEDSINIKCGAVVVYFHSFGRKTPVLIDTLIPFIKGTNTPIFSHPIDQSKSPWFCLIEKAYAKLYGSYSEICGGLFSQAIYSLYGYYSTLKKVTEIQSPTKISKVKPYERLLKYQRKNAIMAAAIHPDELKEINENEITEKGLITTHSYLILKLKQFEGKNFICLRNPWGEHEWNGDWSDNSPLWSNEMKSKFGLEVRDDGTFWMIDSDFFKYFSEIEICKPIPKEWHSRSFFYDLRPGSYDDINIDAMEAFNQNLPRFAFQVNQNFKDEKKCRFHILCERRHNLTKEDIPPFCIELKSRYLFSVRVFTMVGQSHYISFPYVISSNDEMLMMHLRRLGKCSFSEGCYVKVFCDLNFKLMDVNKPEIEIKEEKKTDSVFDNISLLKPISPSKSTNKRIDKDEIKTPPKKVEKQVDKPIQNNTNKQSQNNSPSNPQKQSIQSQNNSPSKPQKQSIQSQNNSPSKPQKQSIQNQNDSPSKKHHSDQLHEKERNEQSNTSKDINKPYQSPPKSSSHHQLQSRDRPKTPQSAQRPNSRQLPEKDKRAAPLPSPLRRPKVSHTQFNSPAKRRVDLPQPENMKKDKLNEQMNFSPVYSPNPPKNVKPKPPKSIDLDDKNIRKMYNSIRTNVFSSYLH